MNLTIKVIHPNISRTFQLNSNNIPGDAISQLHVAFEHCPC